MNANRRKLQQLLRQLFQFDVAKISNACRSARFQV